VTPELFKAYQAGTSPMTVNEPSISK
jgi:hypothetical protein